MTNNFIKETTVSEIASTLADIDSISHNQIMLYKYLELVKEEDISFELKAAALRYTFDKRHTYIKTAWYDLKEHIIEELRLHNMNQNILFQLWDENER